MIVFDLLCNAGHRFEGWFASTTDFAGQKKRGLVQCPTCGSVKIERVPSAARLNLGAQAPAKPQPAAKASEKAPAKAPEKTPAMEGKDPFAIAQMLYSRMLDELLTKSEDVGSKFPQKARDIFYKRENARPIRGQATEQEHDDLLQEGIPVARLPIPPRDKLN